MVRPKNPIPPLTISIDQPLLGELPESASDTEKYAAWTATSIILAERQETNWSDVIHALEAILPTSSRDGRY